MIKSRITRHIICESLTNSLVRDRLENTGSKERLLIIRRGFSSIKRRKGSEVHGWPFWWGTSVFQMKQGLKIKCHVSHGKDGGVGLRMYYMGVKHIQCDLKV